MNLILSHDARYFLACSGLLQIQPMRNALSYEPGELHLQGTVTDGTAKGMNYKDADRNEKVDINYGGWLLPAQAAAPHAGCTTVSCCRNTCSEAASNG
jgi:hypothetical protein